MIMIQNALLDAQQKLMHLPNPRMEAELLLAYLLERNRSYFIAFPERSITQVQYQQYQQLVEKRASGVPYAYLTGIKEFYGLMLKVTENTLIPRDDTEIIIDQALTKISNDAEAEFSLLDLGTGTGAIALAIKSMRPNISVSAVDYHPDTLAVAAENAHQNGLSIELIQSDWFTELKGRQFDLILSNPPYIDPDDEHLDNDGIRYEPIRALTANSAGYADLFHLIEEAPRYLKNRGILLLEHGYNQAERLQLHFNQQSYQQVKTHQDYGNNDRVTEGQWFRVDDSKNI